MSNLFILLLRVPPSGATGQAGCVQCSDGQVCPPHMSSEMGCAAWQEGVVKNIVDFGLPPFLEVDKGLRFTVRAE